VVGSLRRFAHDATVSDGTVNHVLSYLVVASRSNRGTALVVRQGHNCVGNAAPGGVPSTPTGPATRPMCAAAARDRMAPDACQAAAPLSLDARDSLSAGSVADNPFGAHRAPPLATVRVPTLELGQRGMQVLAGAGDGGTYAQRKVLPTDLVIPQPFLPAREVD
jgi:hypothetical protein